MGWQMRLRLRVRRFLYDNHECKRQIFTEQLSP